MIDTAVDTTTLSELDYRFLQPAWDALRLNYGYILKSPLFPPLFALSFDYILILIFSIIDLYFCDWTFFKTAKIQKDRKVTWSLIKESLKLQFFNNILYVYPMALVQLIWVPEAYIPPLAPTVWEIFWQISVFFLSFDLFYFTLHYLMHRIRWLYRWCHSVHHMYSSPFAAASQHLHPFELFIVATFITTFPWLFNTHCLTYWLWFAVAQIISYEVHIGYDFPFFPHRFFPFYSGAPAHDMHHMRPLTCYQPWFNYLDRIFGHHISYDDLKKMGAEKAKRYGIYEDGDERGLKKLN